VVSLFNSHFWYILIYVHRIKCARPPYRKESLHPLGHYVAAAVFREMIKVHPVRVGVCIMVFCVVTCGVMCAGQCQVWTTSFNLVKVAAAFRGTSSETSSGVLELPNSGVNNVKL